MRSDPGIGASPKTPRTPGAWRTVPTTIRGLAFVRRGGLAVLSECSLIDSPRGTGERVWQWHVSVTKNRRRVSDSLAREVLREFGMAAAEEDNHHPGNARHFFLPVDPAHRVECECKTTETVVTEPDGYRYSQPTDGPCAGCELEALIGKRCSIHAPSAT